MRPHGLADCKAGQVAHDDVFVGWWCFVFCVLCFVFGVWCEELLSTKSIDPFEYWVRYASRPQRLTT